MNEGKLLTLRFPFRAIRFRPGGWSGRVGAITPHILGSKARTRGYHANDPPEDSGESGTMSIWPAVMHSFFLIAQTWGHEKPLACLSSFRQEILYFFSFSSFLLSRDSFGISCIFFVSVDSRPFLLRVLDPPNSKSSFFALFRESGTRRLSWSRTDHCKIENDKDKREAD